jgi:7 transmembrane receptor (rhodopsin family).
MIVAVVLPLLVVLAVVSMVTNTACIYVILRSKTLLKRPSTLLLLNLLVVHFVQSVIVFPLYAAKKADAASGLVCDGFRFTYMLTFYTAVYSVLLIAIDRVLATFFVLQYKELVTKQRVTMAILMLWTSIIVLCLIPFRGKAGQNTSNLMKTNRTNITKQTCTYKQTKLWSTLMLLLNCVLPYCLIVIGYQAIIRQIQHIETRSRSATVMVEAWSHDGNRIWVREEVKRHKRVTKLSLILSVVYLLLWSPSFVYYNLVHFCSQSCFISADTYFESPAETYVSFFVKYVAFLDAIAAPLIYCFYHKEFREEGKEHLRCSCVLAESKSDDEFLDSGQAVEMATTIHNPHFNDINIKK